MALSIGMQRAKRASVAASADRRKYVKTLKLRDGQTRTKFWFNGGPEEPYERRTHRMKSKERKFDRQTCTDNEECVFCYSRENGNKGVNGSSSAHAYNIVETVYYHKAPMLDRDTKKPVQKRDGSGPMMIDKACAGPDRCVQCKKKEERFRGGDKVLDIATMFGDQLIEEAMAISGACAACWQGNGDEDSGTGRIEVTHLECPECSTHIPMADFDPMVADTIECPNKKCESRKGAEKWEVVPVEVVVCSNGCENAKRVSIFDGPWEMTKSGKDTATRYTFKFQGVQPRPEWLMEYEAADLVKALGPLSPRKQAEILGIANPFAQRTTAGGKTVSYDDESDPTAGATPEEPEAAAEEDEEPFSDE